MSTYVGRFADSREVLKWLVSWWYHNDFPLSDGYLPLEDSGTNLRSELESIRRELGKSRGEREAERGTLLSVLESLDNGVVVLDHDLSITIANRHFYELAGDADEARVRQLLGERLVYSLTHREPGFVPPNCKRVIRKANGTATPVTISIRERLDNEDQHIGYILILEDVSGLTCIESEAERTRRLAALGEMAVGITHEVRSPLGGIELYATLIADRCGREAKRFASEILHAVHRLQTTISRLLSFAAEPRINAEAVSIPVLLQEVREAVFPLLHEGKWQLITEVEGDLPPVLGDRVLLTQALTNLVVNAAEAMPQGGNVRLQARRAVLSPNHDYSLQEVQICVEDEGLGIPPQDLEKIFDPFFTTKPAGTGLGLALTHNIIRAHSGAIEVSSIPALGSRLTVFLPIAGGGEPRDACAPASFAVVQKAPKEREYEKTNCHS